MDDRRDFHMCVFARLDRPDGEPDRRVRLLPRPLGEVGEGSAGAWLPAPIVRADVSHEASLSSLAEDPAVPTSTSATVQPRVPSSRPSTAGQVSSS